MAIQAVSALPDTVAAVRALASHPDFDVRNPNRVRVGSFSAGNQVRFHVSFEEGYRFLAETILALEPMNPRVAARVVSPLGQWRPMGAGRQGVMRGELQRVLDAAGLSRDTRKMAGWSLAT